MTSNNAPPRTIVQSSRVSPLLPAICAAVGCSGVLTGAHGADATDGSAASAGTLDAVVITGTNREDRTSLNSLAPVDVVTAKQLKATGATTISEALVRLNPAVDFPQTTVATMSANGKAASLYGMSPDQTLVLVDGKRLVAQAGLTSGSPPIYGYGTQPVDIDIIPLAAVDHIEILRSGASALYGSDAISGVINIVLKKERSGGELDGLVGTYDLDDDHKGDEPYPTSLLQAWHGFALPNDGSLTLSAEYGRLAHPQQGVANPNPLFGPPGSASQQGSEPDYNPWRHLMGYSGTDNNLKLLANAAEGISGGWSWYGNASLAYFKRVSPSTTIDTWNAENVISLFPDGEDQWPVTYVTAWTSAAGLTYDDGALGHFDLGFNYGSNAARSYQPLADNPSLGAASPTSFDTGTYRTSLANGSLDWKRDFDWGLTAAPLTLSSGVAFRQDQFEQLPGDWASWYTAPGAVIGPGHYVYSNGVLRPLNPDTPAANAMGISPAQEGTWRRHVASIYVDAEGNPIRRLTIGAAVRHEHYSDFGATTSGKLSGLYEFTPALSLRATITNGFRAPSLSQTHYLSDTATAIGTVLVPTLGLPVSSPLARLLGAQPLKPETSVNYSLGAIWRPFSDFSVVADAVLINVAHKIILSENLQDAGNGLFNAFLIDNGYQTGTVARFFTNGLDTRTEGGDVSADYKLHDTPIGSLDLTAAFAYADNRVTRVSPTPPELASTDVKLIGIQMPLLVTAGAPKTKLVLGETFLLPNDRWQIDALEKRYGTYEETYSEVKPTIQTFSPQTVVDVDVSYSFEFLGVSRVHVGAKDLLNSYPDAEWPSNRRIGQTYYSNLSPEGFDGRFVYFRYTLDF